MIYIKWNRIFSSELCLKNKIKMHRNQSVYIYKHYTMYCKIGKIIQNCSMYRVGARKQELSDKYHKSSNSKKTVNSVGNK